MHNRPSNKQLLEGLDRHNGNVSAYSRELNIARRTVAYWIENAKEGIQHRSQSMDNQQDLFELEVEEDAPELAYIHDQVSTVKLPSTGWKTFTEEEINDFFLQFSNKGYNKTQLQIRNHFDLSPQDWAKIKNHFGIYKLSNVFWDFSFKAIPPAEREQAVADRLASVFKNPNKVVDRAYTTLVQRQAKKTITENTKKIHELDSFITALASEAAANPIKTLTRKVANRKNTHYPKEILVAVSDIHINARVEGLDIQDFNNDILTEYLERVAIEANKKDADSVAVLLNGDLIESFTGKSHPDSFVEMEQGQVYAQGLITARDILLDFLSQIDNLDKVLVIGGNHCRLASSNKEDTHQGASRILAEFMKYALPEVQVEWSHKLLKHEIGNLEFLASHGDKKFVNKDFNRLMYMHGSQDKFTILLTGHYHSRKIHHDEMYGRHIALTSLFTGNTYSDLGGWTTKPGFAIFSESDFGTLIHEDVSL